MDITHDITSIDVRKKIIDDINNYENRYRKEESFRRFEIYRDRQEKYILQRLAGDTSVESVRDMRTFTSINLTKKMVHELASIYLREPERDFTDLNDMQKDTMLAHYKYARANVELKNSNRMFKLHDQSSVKIMPKKGFISMDVLQPHHYDVVPNMMNPEKGEVYVISSFDRQFIDNQNDFRNDLKSRRFENRHYESDGVNQSIGDKDDWKKKEDKKIYYFWSDQYNFITNGKGRILNPETKQVDIAPDMNDYLNPISKLPFVDIADCKDFEYWVRNGNGITEFNIDFGVILSDNVNINKNQGFAIPVITSVEEPQNLKIGPDRAIWLKVDPNDDAAQRPQFQFVTPNPDLQGALQMSEDLLKYFLVSKSINIKDMLQGTATASSGIERLLMMIEKFEASQDDIDLYRDVEQSVYETMFAWHNEFRQANNGLNAKVQGPAIPENSEVMVKFGGPEMIQSKKEHLDWVLSQLDNGLMSSVEAIEELREVDEDTAKNILAEIQRVETMSVDQMAGINAQIANADFMNDDTTIEDIEV